MNLFHTFTDEFIADHKEYLDFLIRDNMEYLTLSLALWGALGLALYIASIL